MASFGGNIDGVEETEGMLEFGESGMISSRIHVQVSSSGNFWMGRGRQARECFLDHGQYQFTGLESKVKTIELRR